MTTDYKGRPFGLEEIQAYQGAGFELRGVVPRPKEGLPFPDRFDSHNEEYRPVTVVCQGQGPLMVQFVRPIERTSAKA